MHVQAVNNQNKIRPTLVNSFSPVQTFPPIYKDAWMHKKKKKSKHGFFTLWVSMLLPDRVWWTSTLPTETLSTDSVIRGMVPESWTERTSTWTRLDWPCHTDTESSHELHPRAQKVRSSMEKNVSTQTCLSWKIPPVQTSLAGWTSTGTNSPASFSSRIWTQSSSLRVTSLHLHTHTHTE